MRHILKTWRCYQHPLVGQRRKDKISFPDKDSKNTDTDNQCSVLLLHVQSELVKVLWKQLKNKIQLDATYYFIMLMLDSTCFGHHYAHHQELTAIVLVPT